jgi:hypothetical protein
MYLLIYRYIYSGNNVNYYLPQTRQFYSYIDQRILLSLRTLAGFKPSIFWCRYK